MIDGRAVCRECFSGLLGKRVALPIVTDLDGNGFDMEQCPGCGVRFETVAKGGLFGCPACYSSFNRFAASVLANDSGQANRQ
ncbi:MAG: hypothetical protein ABIV13_00775 [Fimbriimonadales bacterium]